MTENGPRSNREIWDRITRIENRLETIYKDLKIVRTNDLVHLEKKIDRNSDKIDGIERKLAMAAGALAALQVLIPLVLHIIGE